MAPEAPEMLVKCSKKTLKMPSQQVPHRSPEESDHALAEARDKYNQHHEKTGRGGRYTAAPVEITIFLPILLLYGASGARNALRSSNHSSGSNNTNSGARNTY